MSETKICKRCGTEYPATTEYFTTSKGNRGNNKRYLKRTCRKCTNSDVNARYHRVVKHETAKKKEIEGPKERIYTCKLLPYSLELNCYIRSCPGCKRDLPANTEYFFSMKNGKLGVGGHCKECRGFKFTPILDVEEGYARCPKCELDLLVNEENFHIRKDGKNGFKKTCRKCIGIKEAQFRKDNLEMMRERNHKSDIKRKDFKKIWRHEKYWADPESFAIKNKENYEAHREQRNLYTRNRYKDNPKRYEVTEMRWRKSSVGRASVNKCRQKRRALKRSLPHDFTAEQWITCKEHFNFKCAYCEEDTMMDHDLDQEHFICVEDGGGYTVGNIICACRTCNSRKHTSNPFEWFPLQLSYTKEREDKILNYLNIFDMSGIQQFSLF